MEKMLVFYNQEDFYRWLPYDKDAVLKYAGVNAEEFYGRYLNGKVAELASLDVKDLMELLTELAFTDGVNSCGNY
jgi:hypothetical protein